MLADNSVGKACCVRNKLRKRLVFLGPLLGASFIKVCQVLQAEVKKPFLVMGTVMVENVLSIDYVYYSTSLSLPWQLHYDIEI